MSNRIERILGYNTRYIERFFLENATIKVASPSVELTTLVYGPLVKADEPNKNGALFSVSDLQFGLPSLEYSPLTVNHGDYAIGYIQDAEIKTDETHGTHIKIDGRVWNKRFSNFWTQIENAVAINQCKFSMECFPEEIDCLECGCSILTKDPNHNACEHIRNQKGLRRQINPTFYGVAVVLPPANAGWPEATLMY